MLENLKNNWYYVLAVLVLIACLGWLFPSYRREVKENEELKSSVSDLQQRLVTASTTKVSSKTFYPTGQLASETTSETDTNSSSITNSHSDTNSSSRSHSEVTTQRGLLTVAAYINLKQEIAGSVTYQVLGPIGIGALFANGQPYFGVGLSF